MSNSIKQVFQAFRKVGIPAQAALARAKSSATLFTRIDAVLHGVTHGKPMPAERITNQISDGYTLSHFYLNS